MSTLKTNNVQVGQSGTATNNFTLYQPSTPDGTVRLGVGNTGATTADVITANNSGNVGIGTSSPGQRLQISNASSSGFAAIRMAADSRSYDVGVGGSASGFQQNNWYVYDVTGAATRLVLDTSGNLQFNSGYGSAATAYGCRAWVSFNGTGTVAIRASGNCSSITDNGTGDYTFNFVNAMPDANYAAIGNCDTNASFSVQFVCMFNNPTGNTDSAPTTSSFRFGTRESSGSARDEDYVLISVFR